MLNKTTNDGIAQWHQLGHMQIVCILPRTDTDNLASTSSLDFYGPGALADTQGVYFGAYGTLGVSIFGVFVRN